MKIDTRIVYPVAPPEVSAMTFDEDFQARKCEATGAASYEVELARTPDGARITTSRRMPTAQFPEFVRSMVGATVTVTEVHTWGAANTDGARSGAIEVRVRGAPLRLSGTLHLRPTPDGAVVIIDAELNASVPFVGGRLEKAAAPAIYAAVRAEERTAAAWLAARA